MRRTILLAAVLATGCGDKAPPPAAADPAADKKQQDELKQLQKDASKKKIKEGIPPEEN